MATREFTFKEGTSDKFWKITLQDKSTTVNFGRTGTSGQVQTKDFSSADEAKKNYDKLIAEKLKKGYVECATAPGSGTAASSSSAVPQKKTKAAGATHASTAVSVAAGGTHASAAVSVAAVSCVQDAAPVPQASRLPEPPVLVSTTPAWLKDALASAAALLKTKVPAWINVADLPPILVDKKKLSEEHAAVVLRALQAPAEENAKDELPRDAYYELMHNASVVIEAVMNIDNIKDAPDVTWGAPATDNYFEQARSEIESLLKKVRNSVGKKPDSKNTEWARYDVTAPLLYSVAPIMFREYWTRLHHAGGDKKEADRLTVRGIVRGSSGTYRLRYIHRDESERQLKRFALEKLKTTVLAELAKSPSAPKKAGGASFHPLISALRDHADPGSLDAFAWRLFELWMAEGAPSIWKWAFLSLAAFGGDKSVLKLTPLIRAWPGESQHQRAVLGLEILRQIGSDTALMQLNGIAQKLPFKGLKQKANEFMEAIAKTKGLTKPELEDRVVPDCDLDERGGCVFDFGPRKFSFLLGPEMKPVVRDEAGNIKDLPAPGAKDDAELARQSVEKWKLMKKQIKEVAKIQAVRLEQAMVVSRRWKSQDFETLIVKHPLMINLARLLLWGGFDASGKLLGCFRVTDEQDFADVKDEPLTLKNFPQIGIVHPLEMADADKNAWGQVFADYNIIPPFPQLGRAVLRLEKDEEKQTEIARFSGVKLPAPTLVFGLEKMGWQRGAAQDAGMFYEHTKAFYAAQITAVVEYEGNVGMGYIDPNENLELKKCYFLKGLYNPQAYEYHSKEKALKLSGIGPIVISETLSDLQMLASKAK
ncbi:MAG TPA: DUF4132 domain-containing protein [Planctomycetota bacterium]|jgi:predicted DNA-binding WGR domain protein